MSAMSASSAAPASLMPLSLIAEHKSSQPPPAVQSLPRTGSEKCVSSSSITKPTANGMEGSGPIPLVSQLPQTTATSLAAMPDLNVSQHSNTNPTSNSDNVQLPSSHPYQPGHQNLIKSSETGSAQEGVGTSFTGTGSIVTTMTSSERRHSEETSVHHHQISSTVSTFSSISTTTTTTTEQHSRPSMPAQLLQLQPSQPAVHQTPTAVNISSESSSTSSVGSTLSNSSQITTPNPTENVTKPSDDLTKRTIELTTPQTTTSESNNVSKPITQQTTSVESVTALPSSTPAQQPAVAGQVLADSSQTVAGNVNISPKLSQVQETSSDTASESKPTVLPTSSPASPDVSPSSTVTTTTNNTSTQPATTETSNLKVATIPRQTSKRAVKVATSSPATQSETSKKSAVAETLKEKDSNVTGDKPRRKRLPTQPYQCPIPELNIIAKFKKMKEMNEKDKVDKRPSNSSSDKLIVFYRNEFLAVRNAEGSFYICQAMQNVYKSSSRIKIRWLSQQPEPSSDLYTPDFYDHTEFDCILTNLNLERVEKEKFRLPEAENRRTESILQRALDVERGVAPPPADDTLTETHPDGLDLSLYRNEEQLKKRKKNKKKTGKKKEPAGDDGKRVSSGTTRRRVASAVSASAVSKAKKAAAIKRTAAVKKVVQQAAAAKKQAPTAIANAPNKKVTATSNATNTITNKSFSANATAVKKETKGNSPSALGKRKIIASQGNSSAIAEKRSKRGPLTSQQTQPVQQSSNTSATVSKTRGTVGATSNSNSNKTLTSNTSGGGGTSASNGKDTATGGSRRTLRNSK